jgi:hypothetical protein
MDQEDTSYKKRPSFGIFIHGWDEQLQAEKLLGLIEKYFGLAGVEPQECSLEERAVDKLRHLTMRNTKQRLLTGVVSNLASLTAYHFADKKNKGSEIFYISCDQGYGDQTLKYIDAISDIGTQRQNALAFLKDALDFVTPYYGYSLEMPLGSNPALFSIGMSPSTIRGQAETHAWQQASHAQLDGTKHREGFFRHVFEINVLSPPHLANKIGKTPFVEWVKEPGHGKLEQWKKDVWVWFLPREDRVRCAKILQFNGLLTAPEGFESVLIG